MVKVAVLGCGPSGLLAAHAVRQCGVVPTVISSKKKSALGGAQFLHQAIPGLTGDNPDKIITYRMQGTPEGYARKVYGTDAMAERVSAKKIEDQQEQAAWNLIRVYDQLWQEYEPEIVDRHISAQTLEENKHGFDLIINSVPKTAICKTQRNKSRDPMSLELPHTFTNVEVWIVPSSISELPEGTISYNGDRNPAWYRQSMLWGIGYTEYPFPIKPPLPGTVLVKKPLSNNCNCFPYVWDVGRYGTWRKGELVNHAYVSALEAMRHMFGMEPR